MREKLRVKDKNVTHSPNIIKERATNSLFKKWHITHNQIRLDNSNKQRCTKNVTTNANRITRYFKAN